MLIVHPLDVHDCRRHLAWNHERQGRSSGRRNSHNVENERAAPRIPSLCSERWNICRERAPLWSRRDHNVAKGDVALFAALQIDRSGQGFVAVQRATGDAGNLPIVDDRVAV